MLTIETLAGKLEYGQCECCRKTAPVAKHTADKIRIVGKGQLVYGSLRVLMIPLCGTCEATEYQFDREGHRYLIDIPF